MYRASYRLVSLSFAIGLTFIFLSTFSGRGNSFNRRSDASPDHNRRATPKLQHEYLSSGLVKTNMKGRHPLLELINQAEIKWDALIARQSKTLHQARAEYKHRYKRAPPPGFDDWYAFAVDHDFILIDEFDQINNDIAPLLALPRSALLERLAEAKEASEKSGFIIDIHPAQNILTLKGPGFSQMRAKLLHSLILGVSRWLPDLTIYGSGEDRSGRIMGHELRNWIFGDKGILSSSLLQKLENPFRKGRRDIFSACLNPPPDHLVTDTSFLFQEQHEPTFIFEPSLASDLCLHPSLIYLHGSLSATSIARGSRIFPEFVFGKLPSGTEILLPDTAGFDSFTMKMARPWSEKSHNKLFWRGISTGGSYRQGIGGPLGWRGGSQRIRAAFTFSNDTAASSPPPYISKNVSLLSTSSTGKLEVNSYSRTTLNSLYADVALIKPIVQCNEADGTCDAMKKEVHWHDSLGVWGVERSRWKYVLDLDSNGHSADFITSLGLGSVVLKSTIFPHWNSDWLIPYYHYIPVQQDYSDVYSVMAFFLGPPVSDSHGVHIDTSRGHDILAQKIGENAEKFVRTMWRWEDMQVYMYRLLLEYARLVDGDRIDDL